MPGLKIVLSTDEAERGARNLKKELETLGLEAVNNEAEFKRLEDRMRDGLKADKAKAAMAGLEKSLNMTRLEVVKFKASIGDYSGAINTLSEGLEGVGKKLLSTKNLLASAFVGSGIVAGLAQIKDKFKEFETALTDMGKVTSQSQAEIRAAIMNIDPVLGDATSLMKGYYQTISAGVTDPVKALDFLTQAAKTANASHVEQGEVVKALSKLLAGYAGDIKTASDAADLLFSIEKEGQTSVAELVPVIGDLAAISHEVGVRQTEMAGALSLITQTSGSTSEAATKYKAILVGLYKPGKDLTDLIESIGYSSGVAMVKQLGLSGSLEKIKTESNKAGIGLGSLFESQEALIGISALSANSFETMAEKERAIVDGAGSMEKAYEAWQKTMEATDAVFENTIKKFAIEFGTELAPAMQTGMKDFTQYLQDHRQEILSFFESIGDKASYSVGKISALADEMSTLISIFNSIPSEITGAAGYGIVGHLIFGGKAGGIISTVALINNSLASMNDNLGAVVDKHYASGQAVIDLYNSIKDAATGNTDWLTGENLQKVSTGVKEVSKAINEQTEGFKKYSEAKKNVSEVSIAGNTEGQLSELQRLESQIGKLYQNSTQSKLSEYKADLANYKKLGGQKPEYEAFLQSEIEKLEKRANSSSIAEQKKATAAYKKELEEQKQAVEAFNEEHKKATLSTFDYEIDKLDEWYAEQLYLVEKGLISRQDLEETYADKWFEIYDDDVADFVDAQQKKTDAVEKEKEEILKLEKEAYEKEQELIKASKEAYDKIYEKAYDFTRDVIEDFDNMGNTLVDLAEKMVKDIAAAFLTQTIVMPVYMYAANSLGFSSLISSGSGSTSSLNGSSLASTVSGAYDAYGLYSAYTGGTTNTIASILGSDAVSSVGTSVFGSSWGTYGTISDVAYIIGEDGTMVSVNAGSAGASYSTGLVNSLSSAGTAAIISSLAYTYLGDMVGLPQGEYSGIGAGVGGAAGYVAGTSIASAMGTGATYGAYYGPIGAIIGAVVGGVASSFIGDDTPDYRLGLFPGNFDWEGSNRVATSDKYAYSIATQDYDVKNATSLFDFYDQVFAVLDEATTASINDIILNAQTGDYGRIGWFDPTGSTTEENLTRMTTDVFKAIREGLVEDIGDGFSGDVFTFDFFESIQADSETLLDTYLGFRSAIETLGESEFLEQFNFQVDTLGYSAAEAYENIQTIATTIDEVSEAADALGSVETYSAIADNVDAWSLLNDTLTTVKASTEQLNRVEQARNESLGADLSGLTAESIFSGITSGVDISTTIADRVTEIAVSSIAQDIYDDYISQLNQEIGKVFADSGYDLNVVIDYINGIDTSEAQDAIQELQSSFGLLSDDIESFNESLQDIIDENSLSDYAQSLKSLNDWYDDQLETATDLGVSIDSLNKAYYLQKSIIDDTADAARIVTRAIDGQLSASQQFAEWGINNADALYLYTEMIGASVTQDELEGAIDAFVELGLQGDELNTVIEDLADRFTDATDQILSNISSIESAQGTLTDTTADEADTSEYLAQIGEALSFFQDIPSIAQIMGDEEITKEVFNADDYQKAFAEYVVNTEFETLLGRIPASDYWVNQLLDSSSGITFDNIEESILNGISTNEDIVAEIFNRLFGRSPSGTYWVDALNDPTSGITSSNIESSILAGASAEDLAYYKEHLGVVDTPDWLGFDMFDTIQDHLTDYASTIYDFISGVSDPTFTDSYTYTMPGEFSTSEAEVMDMISQLENLPDIIVNGVLNESALSQVIDVLGNTDNAAVLEDIFGADAADQINSLAGAIDGYYSSMDSAGSTTDSFTNELELAIDAIREYRESIWTGDDSPYSESVRKDLVYQQLTDAYDLSMTGDVEAMQNLPDLSDQYLSLSKDTSSTWSDYQRDAIRVATMLADVEGTYGFATGGSFTVSGSSGMDALSLPNLRVTAGELVNISTPDTMAGLLTEVQSLRAQVATLTAVIESSAENTGRLFDLNDKWDKLGVPVKDVA